MSSRGRRDRLLDAAETAFCRLGYARTTIGELAAEAGVTRPTVYAYFPSKDDVFRALADRVRDEFQALQDRVDTTSPAHAARVGLVDYLDAYTRHVGLLTVIAHQALSDAGVRDVRDEIVARLERRNTRFLLRLEQRGLARPVIPAADLSRAITGLVARSAELVADHPEQATRLAEQLGTVYLSLAGIADGPATHP